MLTNHDPLNAAGIYPSHFTGYFAREVAENGCIIYVSCYNEQHIDEVKPKLNHFLKNQTGDNNGTAA